MKISWKWLGELVEKPIPDAAEVARILTSRGLEVEEVTRLDEGFEKVVTAKILERKQHPGADRLSLCQVVSSEGAAPIQIVCGAQNMKAGDVVALAQVGAQLPNGLKIAESKIRGEVSFGMLCSEEELKLKDSSEGILILPVGTALGQPVAKVLGQDDRVLTLKPSANRGDCLSHLGVAREVAAALGCGVKALGSADLAKQFTQKTCPIQITLLAGESAPQFLGCMIEGVKIGPSPAWVQNRLQTLGTRAINNVVDATNLVLLELGHPVHAYDADRIEGGKIGVRMAKQGEDLPLLDGKSVTLQGTELVIFDGKRVVGLAGVMGGGNSEVQDTTSRVFLECAEFDRVLVRRASKLHGRRTEAAARFEKGVDPLALFTVISRLAELVTQFAGGKVTGGACAFTPSRSPTTPANQTRREIELAGDFIPKFLGMTLAEAEWVGALKALGCQVKSVNGAFTVQVPSYRLDLSIPQDLAEEVARHIGFDRIPATIPKVTTPPFSQPDAGAAIYPAQARQRDQAKDILVRLGFRESLNYGFTSKSVLTPFGWQDAKVRVLNPLSEEHEIMVPSLLPGLLQNQVANQNHHFGAERLALKFFELRPTFHGDPDTTKTGDPQWKTGCEERWRLALLMSGPRIENALKLEQGDLDFYDLKGALEGLFEGLGTKGVRIQEVTAQELEGAMGAMDYSKVFHPGRTLSVRLGNQFLGFAGQVHPKLEKGMKLREVAFLAELDWAVLSSMSRGAFVSPKFKSWSEFPGMERDFALVVPAQVPAERLVQVALKAGKPLVQGIRVFDVFEGKNLGEGMKSIALRVSFSAEGRSLQELETEAVSGKMVDAWTKECSAQLRS